MVDVVYVAASSHDARFTRICVASLRYFYPGVPIEILAGGRLRRGLARELRDHWRVRVVDLPEKEYGWGFVKLEPLFAPAGRRFLVVDSDTVITGPVLNVGAEHDEDFIVDDEVQPPQRAREIYYDCSQAVEVGRPVPEPAFLFNTGQWFGTSGVLSREDFGDLIKWTFPRKVAYPSVFKNGEQGVFNFVINEASRAGRIRVARVPLMCWPARGTQGLSIDRVLARAAAPVVVHWAGLTKAPERQMAGADLLAGFEEIYYSGLPYGRPRQLLRLIARRMELWLTGVRRVAGRQLRRVARGQR